MARLTWQNVNTPNFSGVADSYRVMSQLLGNATQSGLDMIDTYNTTNAQAADRAILQRMAGVQDPAQFDANSIIGGDGARASLDTLQRVGDRPGTLLDWATNRENLNQTQYTNRRLQDGNARMDAAGEAARQFAVATRNNDQATANNLLRTNPALANLRPDQLIALMAVGDTLASNNQSRTRTGQLIDQSTHNFDRQVRDEGITDATQAALAELARTASDPQHAEQLMWRYAQENNVAPEVINNLISRGIGAVQTSGGAGGITPSGSDPSRSMNYEARASGFNAVPNDVRTLGQASDFALRVNDANRARTGEAGSSAMGMYQIVGSTLRSYAPRVFGENWQNVDFTPQNQDRLAQAIFDDNKGSADALRKQWVSLSPAEAERVRQMPWEQAREVIAQKESGATPGQLRELLQPRLALTDAQFDLQRADTTANSNSLNRQLAELEGAQVRSIDVIAKELVDGPFAGYNTGRISDELRAITGRTFTREDGSTSRGLNLEQAAAILRGSQTQRNWFMRNMFENTPQNTWDDDRVESYVNDYLGGSRQTVRQNNERALVSEQVRQLEAQVAQIDAAILNATQRLQQTGAPEHRQRIEQLRAQKSLLRAALDTAIDEVGTTPGWTETDLQAEARRQAELQARAAASSPEAVAAQQRAQAALRRAEMEARL